MMDYYEEWGISRSAPVAEIHQVYRRLMQLVHPDHCSDETGRRLAELQSKRLNAILRVLTDPVQRRRYDRRLSLEEKALARRPAAPWRLARAPWWLWPTAAVVAVVTVLVMMAGPSHDVPPMPAAQIPPAPLIRRPPPRRHINSAAAPRNRAPEPRLTARPPAAAGDLRRPGILPQSPPPEVSPRADPQEWTGAFSSAPQLPEAASLRDRETLAGEWLAPPQPVARNPGSYPQEYAEMRVTEDSGILRGRFRARYRVDDRAISPVVDFEFEGRANGNAARLNWIGGGGSRGEVTLRVLASGSLAVAWIVHQMGSEIGLVSGTATLIRKEE